MLDFTESLNNHLLFGSRSKRSRRGNECGSERRRRSLPLATYFASLGNGVLHDASHVGDGEVDVLLPEVLFDASVVVVVQTLVCVVCAEKEEKGEEPTQQSVS